MIVVYADIETSGLDPKTGAEITEVGLIKCNAYWPYDIFYSFFSIKGSIPPDLVQETGITREMLAGFPAVQDRVSLVKNFIGRAPIIAYNARFEQSFFNHYGITDVGHLYIDLYPWIKEMRLPTVNNKLQTILKHYQLVPTFAHRALSDALALHNLVYKLRWMDRLEKVARI